MSGPIQSTPPSSTSSAPHEPASPWAAPQGRREELERLRLLGMLVANVAHEINNHLSYVVGNLERVNRRAPHLRHVAGAQVTSDVDAALDGARRIAEIVRSLSTFARGETRLQQVDPLRALEGAIRLAKERIAGRARLVLELAPLPTIEGSESQLSQVFLNVLINAADAIPEGAPESHQIRVRASVGTDTVAIEVEDTGHGIARHDIDRVFEPFFSTKPPGAGTGLGLSVSRDLVGRIGGTISVTSQPGQGSTFRIALPVRRDRADG